MIRTIDIVTEQEREEASAAEPKSAADLPELAAAAAAADPEAIAFTHGDQAVTFGELSTKLVAMRTAMGLLSPPMLWFLCRSPDLFRASCRHLASTVSPHL